MLLKRASPGPFVQVACRQGDIEGNFRLDGEGYAR